MSLMGEEILIQGLIHDLRFSNNNAILKSSCSQWDVANNSDDEISDLSDAIKSVASSSGVDARFILAIVMQESNGCVRAPTTNYGVRNPGLMQDHDGAGTCNDASVSNPCPASEIKQMITDGTEGTTAGDGLKQVIAQAGTSDVSKYYIAARLYNSGSLASGGNLGGGIATHCYASDIANRLVGWATGASSCVESTVGALTTTSGTIPDENSGSDSGSSSTTEAAVSTTPEATPTATETPVTTSAAASVTDTPGGAFAELTGKKGVSEATATATSSAEASSTTPEATTTADPTTAVAATPNPTISTVIVSPLPSTTSAEVTSTSTSAAAATTAASTGAETAGSSCSTEGLWNCIDGTSFQQCASGVWSVVQSLADGMQCTEGQSTVFGLSAKSS